LLNALLKKQTHYIGRDMTKRKNYLSSSSGVLAIAKQPAPAKVTRYSDGDSLYLIHHPNGSLFWQMPYRYQSDKDIKPKQKTYQIGVFKSAKQDIDTAFKPEVSLKQARVERDKAKQLLADDIDPTEHKNKEKNKYEQKDLFKVVAADYISEKQDTTPKNVKKLQGFLSKHILNHIGDYPITAITAQDVIQTGLAIQNHFEKQGEWTADTTSKCVELIGSVGEWTADTTSKCVELIGSVFEYAINTLSYDIINVAYGRNNRALDVYRASAYPVNPRTHGEQSFATI